MANYKVYEGSIIATRDLPAGVIFLEEEPLMTLKMEGGETMTSNNLGEMVDQELQQMSPSQRKQFLELEDKSCGGKTPLGIARTNVLQLPDSRWAVLKTASLVKHDCLPNSTGTQTLNGKIIFRTVKPVDRDANITMSLLNTWPIVSRAATMKLFATSADRAQILLEQHGFVCLCKSCVNGLDDYKRSRIMQLEFYGDYSDS